MGHLKNKYTKEYYTGKDAKGNQLKYGATSSVDKDGNYILREHDLMIVKKMNFKNKSVLALGCGRGEELVYAIEKGANIENSVEVDFSPAAIKIAKELFKDQGLKSPVFYAEEALDFVINYSKKTKGDQQKKFDIVIMFDFVEHVPREELIKVFSGLRPLLKDESVLVINTPAYRYDNDVIKDGYDERNQIDTSDTSDIVPETKGMHCNKYSLTSLQEFMGSQGLVNITEAHYFVCEDLVSHDFKNKPYYNRWDICKKNGAPILGLYTDDVIESPYPLNADLKLVRFQEGVLDGISLFLTEEYKNLAYPSGNSDVQMMNDLVINDIEGKTIFDVGTFMGASALAFSRFVGKSGKVLGFEPNPFNRNRSLLNISQNPDLSDNIWVYPYALGEENGERQMVLSSEIDSGFSSTSRLKGSHSKIQDAQLPEGFEEVSVQVKTLDTFVKENKIVPDILKVDIEGAEYSFLLGALKTIKKHKPIFYIEIHSEFCAIRCFEILRTEGYSVTIINEEPDNRIMVKAEYLVVKKGGKESRELNELQVLRNQNVTFNLLRSITSSIELIQRDLINYHSKGESLKERNLELNRENDVLREGTLKLKLENSKFEERISSIEGSKSWEITEPLRKFREILSGAHKQSD